MEGAEANDNAARPAASAEAIDGGTVYKYQQEIAQMVCPVHSPRCSSRPKSRIQTHKSPG